MYLWHYKHIVYATSLYRTWPQNAYIRNIEPLVPKIKENLVKKTQNTVAQSLVYTDHKYVRGCNRANELHNPGGTSVIL